jgi:DNA-binding MarR family transcriptional regulator
MSEVLSNLYGKHVRCGTLNPPGLAVIDLIDQVIRLAGRLTSARKMTSEIAPMRPAHWLVLTAVCRACTPPTVARIARSCGQSRQSVQRIANALRNRGFIRFSSDGRDRRTELIAPTKLGKDDFSLDDQEGMEWASLLARGFTAKEIAETASLLAELRRRIEPSAPEERNGLR